MQRHSKGSWWFKWFDQGYWFEDQNAPTTRTTSHSVWPCPYASGNKNEEKKDAQSWTVSKVRAYLPFFVVLIKNNVQIQKWNIVRMWIIAFHTCPPLFPCFLPLCVYVFLTYCILSWRDPRLVGLHKDTFRWLQRYMPNLYMAQFSILYIPHLRLQRPPIEKGIETV